MDGHRLLVEKIRKSELTITEAINKLIDVYRELYDLSPYEINCGRCEDFAIDVVSLIPGAIDEWGDAFINENDDENQYSYHCIVHYQGKFYDSEHPEGVDDFREISAFDPSGHFPDYDE